MIRATLASEEICYEISVNGGRYQFEHHPLENNPLFGVAPPDGFR
jgi:hypothetical protein